jgi:hypothetical protein
MLAPVLRKANRAALFRKRGKVVHVDLHEIKTKKPAEG